MQRKRVIPSEVEGSWHHLEVPLRNPSTPLRMTALGSFALRKIAIGALQS